MEGKKHVQQCKPDARRAHILTSWIGDDSLLYVTCSKAVGWVTENKKRWRETILVCSDVIRNKCCAAYTE